MARYALEHRDSRLAVVAATSASARDVCIEGESGLLRIIPAPLIKTWNRSLGELVLTNESRFKLFSADEPDRLRGYQHHRAWCDELASWRYPDAWDQLLLGLRLGSDPRVVVTTTPRPVALVRGLLGRPDVVVTRGSTFENAANLAPAALAQLRERYEGTRLGRQELYAEVVEDVEGALFQREWIERTRVRQVPQQWRIAVGVDPSGGGNAQGIVVAGLGVDGRGYVFHDATVNTTPEGWGRAVVNAYHNYRANYVVAEVNYGGDMVASTIRTIDQTVPVKIVHASRGKAQRAEPVAALLQQGRISHVGSLPALEDELCTWEPGVSNWSPNRLDAYVWALTDLLVQPAQTYAAAAGPRRQEVAAYVPR